MTKAMKTEVRPPGSNSAQRTARVTAERWQRSWVLCGHLGFGAGYVSARQSLHITNIGVLIIRISFSPKLFYYKEKEAYRR